MTKSTASEYVNCGHILYVEFLNKEDKIFLPMFFFI